MRRRDRRSAKHVDRSAHHPAVPYHRAFVEALRILSRIDSPFVAAARGVVTGNGLGYVYVADIVLAARGTTFFSAGPADIGLDCDGGPHLAAAQARGTG